MESEVRARELARAAASGRAASRLERLVLGARLAPHAAAASALLAPGARGDSLRLLPAREDPAHPADRTDPAEPALWFHPELAARLRLPYLAPHNIRGAGSYVCHECGASFPEPNPLKLHLFVRCAAAEPARLWRTVAERLAEPAEPAEPEGGAASEAAALAWAARLGALLGGGGARGHACPYCGKLYSRRYGLKIHLRTHTGYRPLRCRHCARAFGDPSNLNKHVRLHATAAATAAAGAGAAGSAALACARCGKLVARRRDLERHRRAHCEPRAPPAPAPVC